MVDKRSGLWADRENGLRARADTSYYNKIAVYQHALLVQFQKHNEKHYLTRNITKRDDHTALRPSPLLHWCLVSRIRFDLQSSHCKFRSWQDDIQVSAEFLYVDKRLENTTM